MSHYTLFYYYYFCYPTLTHQKSFSLTGHSYESGSLDISSSSDSVAPVAVFTADLLMRALFKNGDHTLL